MGQVEKSIIKSGLKFKDNNKQLEENIRKIVTSACASVWRDTINDLSAQGSITRSIHYAMREIMELINENNKI